MPGMTGSAARMAACGRARCLFSRPNALVTRRLPRGSAEAIAQLVARGRPPLTNNAHDFMMWSVLRLRVLSAFWIAGYGHSSGVTHPVSSIRSIRPSAVARWTAGSAPKDMRVPGSSMVRSSARHGTLFAQPRIPSFAHPPADGERVSSGRVIRIDSATRHGRSARPRRSSTPDTAAAAAPRHD